MILQDFIEVNINKANTEYFISKGYVICGKILKIKTTDLQRTSTKKIKVKCDICGTEKELSLDTLPLHENYSLDKHNNVISLIEDNILTCSIELNDNIINNIFYNTAITYKNDLGTIINELNIPIIIDSSYINYKNYNIISELNPDTEIKKFKNRDYLVNNNPSK